MSPISTNDMYNNRIFKTLISQSMDFDEGDYGRSSPEFRASIRTIESKYLVLDRFYVTLREKYARSSSVMISGVPK